MSHRAPRLTLHRRGDQGWSTLEAREHEALQLISTAAMLAVDDVYRDGLEDIAHT